MVGEKGKEIDGRSFGGREWKEGRREGGRKGGKEVGKRGSCINISKSLIIDLSCAAAYCAV